MRHITRYLSLFIVCLISMYAGTLAVRSFYTIKKCVVQVDPLIDASCISLMIKNIEQLRNESPSILFSQLKEQFPCITHLSCRYDAHHVMSVSIKVAQPLFRLNNCSLVLDNSSCVAMDWYIPTSYDKKVSLMAPDDSPLENLIAFVEQVPSPLHNRFLYNWKTDFTIYAHDSYHKGSSLVVSKNKTPTLSTIAAYDEIMNNTKKYAVPGEPVNEKWIADARFDDQLIFSHQKGGGIYGNSI